MSNINPLAALISVLLIGTVISAIEAQNSKAAIALTVLILLGIITFNAQTFTTQTDRLMKRLYAQPLKSGGGRRGSPRSKSTQGR